MNIKYIGYLKGNNNNNKLKILNLNKYLVMHVSDVFEIMKYYTKKDVTT